MRPGELVEFSGDDNNLTGDLKNERLQADRLSMRGTIGVHGALAPFLLISESLCLTR